MSSPKDLTYTTTIANGASLSGNITSSLWPQEGLGNLIVYAIDMPAAWTAANITLQIASADGTFRDVYDSSGNEITITAAASRRIVVPPNTYISGGAMRLRSGTAAAPVNQGADRTILVYARTFN